MTEGSEIIWDMTEGRVRLNKIYLHGSGSPNVAVEDIVAAYRDSASVAYQTIESRTGYLSLSYIELYSGHLVAHELGHYLFDLRDEYYVEAFICNDPNANLQFLDIGRAGGKCDDSPINVDTCIMQDNIDKIATELCDSDDHDLIQNQPSATRGYCEGVTGTKKDVKTTIQEFKHKKSCWETLTSHPTYAPLFNATTEPIQTAPGNFVPPTFIDTTQGQGAGFGDVLGILLDVSGSMGWSISNTVNELCGNGLDDDGDSQIDEVECAERRLDVMAAATRAWLDLVAKGSIRPYYATLYAFNQNVGEIHSGVVTKSDVPGFLNAVEGLVNGTSPWGSPVPSGGTAIGSAMTQAKVDILTRFNDPTILAKSRGVLLFSDGHSNTGADPFAVASTYVSSRIRLSPIGVGDVTDSTFMTRLADITGGVKPIMGRPRHLISAFVDNYAALVDAESIIPRMGYRLGHGNDPSNSSFQDIVYLQEEEWLFHNQEDPDDRPGAQEVRFGFSLPYGKTKTVEIIFASTSNVSQGNFGVQAEILGPNGQHYFLSQVGPNNPEISVVNDDFFTIVRLHAQSYPGASDEMAGQWDVRLVPAQGAGANQTGNITVLAHIDDNQLQAHLEPNTLAPGQPATLTFYPSYISPLLDLQNAQIAVKDPQGNMHSFGFTGNGMEAYTSELSGFFTPGRYDVFLEVETHQNIVNHPGETIGDPVPKTLSTYVPLFRRAKSLGFTVQGSNGGQQ